jgi:hypothetical protein
VSCCKGGDTSPDTPTEPDKVFGGCGCFSPDCFRLPDGNYELRDPVGGSIILTPRGIHDLKGMLNEAYNTGLIARPS